MKDNRSLLPALAAFAFLACAAPALRGQAVDIAADPAVLAAPFSASDEAAFRQPDKVFYPETWFHFIGGNVSKEGIDADLEAIAGAGLSGIQWFHGHFGGPWPQTGTQIRALTPAWEDMVSHLSRKADSLGLRLTIQTCPGWAMAGGPWIEPKDAMRMLVWSRTDEMKEGDIVLKLPKGQPSDEPWRDYQDICVLAFPTPEGDTGEWLQPADVAAEDPLMKAIVEGTNDKPLTLAEGSAFSAEFTLPEGEVIRTLQLPPVGQFTHDWVYDPGIHVTLDAITADGVRKNLVDADLPMGNWQDYFYEIVFACNEVKDAARYSFHLTSAHPAVLHYFRISSAARKNSWRGEAGWTLIAKEPFQQHTEQDPRAFIDPSQIVDLTAMMDEDGTLRVTNPGGKWTVLRIGHVNFGQRNSPAPPEATGWECNKLDPRGAEKQFSSYVGMLQDGPLGGKAGGMLMDSWECRTQTWTGSMEQDFASAAGYSLRNWLPALMGYVIGSQENTSRFLIDWRRTLNGLYCENFFSRMTDLAHEKGMKVQYETAGSDVVTMDPIEYFKYADVPMCEFWQPVRGGYVGDLEFKPIRPTASAAHLYGKPRVAAESFTSFSLTWDEHWQMLREVANLNMSAGVTHNVFHTYTHNPQVGFLPPGTSFGSAIGTPFLRGQTWWKYMPEFTGFLARTSYLLERGRPVADILWYLGDEVGHKPFQHTGYGKRQAGSLRVPDGFKYDYCNPDILLNRLTVKDGRLCTPEGIAYEVLWIPENERMLPETLEKLAELIRAGARVIANAPAAPATLQGGAATQQRFEAAVKAIWGDAREGRITRIGAGAVAAGMPLEQALKAFGLHARLVCENPDFLWSERETEGARWYFVAAPYGEAFHGTVRVQGKGKAQWWNPVDGSVRTLKARGWGRYKKVRLELARAEGGFIVFRKDADAGAPHAKAFPAISGRGITVGNWTVRFPEGWGAPSEPVALDSLKAWKDLDLGEEGRAFSGTATYEATFVVPENLVGKDLLLDLGKVDFIADVKVNGQSAGIRWTEPYRLPVGDLVQAGTNTLTVDVTGTWYNRLVFDAGQQESARKTWTISGPAAGSPLRDSGLLGPVLIVY